MYDQKARTQDCALGGKSRACHVLFFWFSLSIKKKTENDIIVFFYAKSQFFANKLRPLSLNRIRSKTIRTVISWIPNFVPNLKLITQFLQKLSF